MLASGTNEANAIVGLGDAQSNPVCADNRSGLERIRDRIAKALGMLDDEIEVLDGIAQRAGYYTEPSDPGTADKALRSEGMVDQINSKIDALEERLSILRSIRIRLGRIA